MILYLDAGALVKRYVAEAGSAEVGRAIAEASTVGTTLITRAEVAAALARAARVGVLTEEEAQAAVRVFRAEWPDLVRVQVTEIVVARADGLAWEHGLRGYDAVHLAAAALWQDAMGAPVTFIETSRRFGTCGRLVPHHGEFMRVRFEGPEAIPPEARARIEALAERYRFFR